MTKKEIAKLFKRFFITFLLCLPIFAIIGVFAGDKIGSAWSIVLYVLIGAIAFVLEEIWYKGFKQRQQQKREQARQQRRQKKLLGQIEESENSKSKKDKKQKDTSNSSHDEQNKN